MIVIYHHDAILLDISCTCIDIAVASSIAIDYF